MRLPQEARNELLTPLVERLERQHAAAPFPDEQPGALGAGDRSPLRARRPTRTAACCRCTCSTSSTLAPGQALFLGAGELHSYLRGVGVEVMANSDNVIRGGLTPKHVDVEALLSIVEVQGRCGAGDRARCQRRLPDACQRIRGRAASRRRRPAARGGRPSAASTSGWRRRDAPRSPGAAASWQSLRACRCWCPRRWAATSSAPSATRSCFALVPARARLRRALYGGTGASGDVTSSRIRLSTRNTPAVSRAYCTARSRAMPVGAPPDSVTMPFAETMLIRVRFSTGRRRTSSGCR